MSRTVVSAESLEKIVQTSAGELVILDGIDLEINKGETVAVVGASGSGVHLVGDSCGFGYCNDRLGETAGCESDRS